MYTFYLMPVHPKAAPAGAPALPADAAQDGAHKRRGTVGLDRMRGLLLGRLGSGELWVRRGSPLPPAAPRAPAGLPLSIPLTPNVAQAGLGQEQDPGAEAQCARLRRGAAPIEPSAPAAERTWQEFPE